MGVQVYSETVNYYFLCSSSAGEEIIFWKRAEERELLRDAAARRSISNQVKTREYDFRISQLKALRDVIIKYDGALKDALWEDLHKSPEEVYLTEISIVLQELNFHIKHLGKWMKPEKVKTPVHLWPSRSRIVPEPLGSALIIAPWNYPFQLLINPLVGALSAGCTACTQALALCPPHFTGYGRDDCRSLSSGTCYSLSGRPGGKHSSP